MKKALVWLLVIMPFKAMGQTAIVPQAMQGQGTLAVSNSSVAVNTLTLSPGSPAFPTGRPSPSLRIKSQATSTAYVTICWLGGTCSAGAGEILVQGESSTKNLSFQNMSTSPPTLICASASACSVEVEW